MWKDWYRRKYNEEAPDDRVPDVFSFENLWERVKIRFKHSLENRRQRMLARLGITGSTRIQEYSVLAGGAQEEVGLIVVFETALCTVYEELRLRIIIACIPAYNFVGNNPKLILEC